MQSSPLPVLTVTRWLAGPLIWTAHFLIVYASESLVCTRGGGAATHLVLVAAATLAGLIVLLAVISQSRRAASDHNAPGQAYMDKVATGLSLLGMLGLIWTALPATLLSACSLPA
jgi:hypothetical protein